jgi:hypothetical protein
MLNGSFAPIKHLGKGKRWCAESDLLSFHHFAISIQFITISFLGASIVCLPKPGREGRRTKKNGKSIAGEAHAKLWPASLL